MRDDRCGLRLGELLAQPQQMAAGQMAGFVREHADDFVRRLGVEQRAGVDEDVAAVHDEGVEGAVVEHDHSDVLLGEAGRVQDRRRVIAQQLLDLGVADDRHAARGAFLRARRHRAPRAATATAVAASARPAARACRWPSISAPSRGWPSPAARTLHPADSAVPVRVDHANACELEWACCVNLVTCP